MPSRNDLTPTTRKRARSTAHMISVRNNTKRLLDGLQKGHVRVGGDHIEVHETSTLNQAQRTQEFVNCEASIEETVQDQDECTEDSECELEEVHSYESEDDFFCGTEGKIVQ